MSLSPKHSGEIDLALPSSNNPFLLGRDATAQKTKSDILLVTDDNDKLNKRDIAAPVAESGASKTSAAFLVASEKYSIYVEASTAVPAYGSGMPLMLSDVVKSGVLSAQQMIGTDAAARGLALLSLYIRGLVPTPYDWLIAQIAHLGHYIDTLYDILKNSNLSLSEMRSLFEELKSVLQYQVPFIVDEAQVMTRSQFGKYPSQYGADWNLLQVYCAQMCLLRVSIILVGPALTIAYTAGVATSVAKLLTGHVVYLVTSFPYLRPDNVRWALTETLDLSQVDGPLLDRICFMLQGRPRFTAGFITYFCKFRNIEWQSVKFATKSKELQHAFDSYYRRVIDDLSEQFRILIQDYASLATMHPNLQITLSEPLESLIDLLRVHLLSPAEQATTENIPLLAYGIVPLQPLGYNKELPNRGTKLPTFLPEPIEPLIPLAIQKYLKGRLYSILLKTLVRFKNSKTLGNELDELVMFHILDLKGKTLTDLLDILRCSKQPFKYPKWARNLLLNVQSIHPICHLDDYLNHLVQASTNQNNGVFSHFSWLQVGAMVDDAAGSDGVIPLHNSSTGQIVLLSFGNCCRTERVDARKWKHQQFKASLYNQYMEIDKRSQGKVKKSNDKRRKERSSPKPKRKKITLSGSSGDDDTYDDDDDESYVDEKLKDFEQQFVPSPKFADRRERVLSMFTQAPFFGRQIRIMIEIPHRVNPPPIIDLDENENIVVTIDDRNLSAFFDPESANLIIDMLKRKNSNEN